MMPLVILGSHPATLAAAHAASGDGRQVILIDENPGPGGQIWRGGAPWSDRRAHALWEALQARPGVQMRFGTRVVARAGPGQLLLAKDGAPQVQAWDRVIVCGGARELLLPFPGWTLPGVTGAGRHAGPDQGRLPGARQAGRGHRQRAAAAGRCRHRTPQRRRGGGHCRIPWHARAGRIHGAAGAGAPRQAGAGGAAVRASARHSLFARGQRARRAGRESVARRAA
ncbi:FAD-dependent oxidoreductase [Massilia sp. H-1]|nr:FAD-dependent oxidoreductase [Massilia sp. H-1]